LRRPGKLKELQGVILREVLEKIHLTGGAWIREGRSIKTFAAPHWDGGFVRMDCETSFRRSRAAVQALFRTAVIQMRSPTGWAGSAPCGAARNVGFAGKDWIRWR